MAGKHIVVLAALVTLAALAFSLGGERGAEMKKFNPLTEEEERVIVHKGTEFPGTGKYLHHKADGTYTCKRCDAPLYRSSDKFDSGCGWPSFDDEIPGAVQRVPDEDHRRTEIRCAACGAHLGHVFAGEHLTAKNVRHCVNSLSLAFVPAAGDKPQTAYFAAGCFWGVEYWFKKEPGVVATSVGYMGGTLDNPTYRDVCDGETGHAEAVKVQFDPKQIDFAKLCRLFFEIHDFTQTNGQGPDLGEQYRSEIFVADAGQQAAAEKIVAELRGKGFTPSTRISRAGIFWPAEKYHQDYYGKNGKSPYCHTRKNVF